MLKIILKNLQSSWANNLRVLGNKKAKLSGFVFV